MKADKPTITLTNCLELIKNWYLAETNTSNVSMSMSMSRSMESFNLGSSVDQKNNNLSQVERVFTEHLLFRHLLDLCVKYPNCNIFHEKVVGLISAVFRSQNHAIINFIFKQNRIINETLEHTVDPKKNGYFGHFFQIIKTYTGRRINTPTVETCIAQSQNLWQQKYTSVLEAHYKIL